MAGGRGGQGEAMRAPVLFFLFPFLFLFVMVTEYVDKVQDSLFAINYIC